jgi:hypothetical protein
MKQPLKIGDKVRLVRCYEADRYKDRFFTVRSEPWYICYGTVELVLLEGLGGGYATKYLELVEEQ